MTQKTEEFKIGDLVAANTESVYEYLVGKIIAIEPAGSPEHDTDNETDDIHVDFSYADYSDTRELDIEKHFEALYIESGESKKFEELPFDDVIMAPEMLVKINDKQFKRFAQNLIELKRFLTDKTMNSEIEHAIEYLDNLQDGIFVDIEEYETIYNVLQNARDHDWVNAAKKLPEDDSEYLVYTKNEKILIASYKKSQQQWKIQDRLLLEHIKYWRLLPDAPELYA